MRPRSLRWRLALLYTAVIALALVATLIVVDLVVERALIDSTAARLEVEAGLITPTSPGRGNAPIKSLAAPEVARALGGQQTAVVILDAGGTALASAANGAQPSVADARLGATTYQTVLTTGATVDRVVSLDGDRRALVVAAPIHLAAAKGTGSGNGNGNGKGLGNGGAGQRSVRPAERGRTAGRLARRGRRDPGVVADDAHRRRCSSSGGGACGRLRRDDARAACAGPGC